MSAKVTNFYRKSKAINGVLAKLVMMVLSEYANEEGTCYPGVPTIAEECNVSDRTIQRTLKNLEDAGEIGRSLNAGKIGKSGRTNLYFLNAYRISVGLEPLITKSPFSGSSVSPRVKSTPKSTKAVTKSTLSGDKPVTQTNTQNHLCVNHKHKADSNPVDNKEFATQMNPQCLADNKESAMHGQRPTDKSARAIKSQTVQPKDNAPVRQTSCGGDKELINENEIPNNLVFPVQLGKVEKAEITNLLVKSKIPHDAWQDLIDTLAYQIKQKTIASKAGYFVGILKKFKSGEFTTSEAQKIQAKRQSTHTSVDALKQKAKQIEQRNTKAVIDEPNAQFIEIINKIQTESKLKAFQMKNISKMTDAEVYAIAKRFQELRA